MDERQAKRRGFAVSAATGILRAVLLIGAALASAVVVSAATFGIALLAAPFLAQITAVVAASVAVLVLVKWINQRSAAPSLNWRVATIRTCGGVVVGIGALVAYSLRNLAGNDGVIALAAGLLLIVLGVAIVLTHPRASLTGPNDDAPAEFGTRDNVD
jgi:hypothetical protein